MPVVVRARDVRTSFALPAFGPVSRATAPHMVREPLGAAERIWPRSGACAQTINRRKTDGEALVSTFALIFVVVWLLGSISSYAMGGFLHIFLFVAIGMVLARVIQGRKVSGY